MSQQLQRPALFLDRDGVINEDVGYLHRIDQFRFLPGVLEACRWMHEAGYLLVVVTNQSGIARGYYSIEQFHEVTQWMRARFAAAGAPLVVARRSPDEALIALPASVAEG